MLQSPGIPFDIPITTKLSIVFFDVLVSDFYVCCAVGTLFDFRGLGMIPSKIFIYST